MSLAFIYAVQNHFFDGNKNGIIFVTTFVTTFVTDIFIGSFS